jgi:hypothetical protein
MPSGTFKTSYVGKYVLRTQQQNGKETLALPTILPQSNITGARLDVFKANMKSTVF